MRQKEKDVLIVRDEKTGEIGVVAGLNKEGTPNRLPAKAEHSQDFLRFDRHGDVIDNFFKNFYRQCKEPSRFGFYRVAAETAEQVMAVMKELLKDPEANKELLAPHKVDTSAYERQAAEEQKQSNEPNKQENEMKEENNGQQAETVQEAATEKKTLISPDTINRQEWQDKYGIDFGAMSEKDKNALLNYGKTGLVTVKPTFGGEQIEIQARLSFRKDDDGNLKLVPHFVRGEPKLDVEHKGHTFTDEEKKELSRTGNLGKTVDLADPKTGELKPHFVSIDRLTKEVIDIPVSKIHIPDRIGNTTISADDKRVLLAGLPLRKEIELKGGRKFTPLLQVNVEQRGVEFVPGSNQHRQKEKKQETGKQEVKEGEGTADTKQQQKKAHWLNADGSIRRLSTYFKKPLTEQQQNDYVAGKTIEIREVPEKEGSGTYTAYVKFDREKQQPRSYRTNPDLSQAKERIPTNENRTQVAVNEQGKTNESTKHIKEPLQPGQDAPKNGAQKERQEEGQKRQPKKTKGMKV